MESPGGSSDASDGTARLGNLRSGLLSAWEPQSALQVLFLFFFRYANRIVSYFQEKGKRPCISGLQPAANARVCV